ncbi:MAG TPA: tryptophan synthase subunit alpha [Gemmatales bacterium]|nr:tryptophan synthase subunit alpha [Gemmatales bacterium]
MPLLEEVLQKCRAAKRPAFIPFITAGDPSLEKTGQVIDALITAGADVIEIGIPYSDPLADGTVIQASYARALNAKTKLADIFTHAAQWTQKHKTTPFLAMVSYSIVFRMGVEHFLEAAHQAGFTGLIIPDLPNEEAVTIAPQVAARQLALIQLVTPTTSKERAAKITKTSTGFLYVVIVTGITGARTALPTQITNQLAELRNLTTLPLCVGFGISTKEHVQLLKPHVDGLIVGSALVKCLEGDQPFEKKLFAISTLAKQMTA